MTATLTTAGVTRAGNRLHRVIERGERRNAVVVHLGCGGMSTVIAGENDPAQCKDAYKCSSSAKLLCRYY